MLQRSKHLTPYVRGWNWSSNNSMTITIERHHFTFDNQAQKISTENRGNLVQRSTVVGITQTLVPEILRARFLHLAHYPLKIKNFRQGGMYDTRRGNYYEPPTTNQVYTTVAKYISCDRNGIQYRHKRPLHIYCAWGPLQFDAMDS